MRPRRIWHSPEYQAKLGQDIEAIKEEFPPKEAPRSLWSFSRRSGVSESGKV